MAAAQPEMKIPTKISIHLCDRTWCDPYESHLRGFDLQFLDDPRHDGARAATVDGCVAQVVDVEEALALRAGWSRGWGGRRGLRHDWLQLDGNVKWAWTSYNQY